jgi:hypothetical protein
VCLDGTVVPEVCTPAVAGFDAGDGSTAGAVESSRTIGVATALVDLGRRTWVLGGGAVPSCGNSIVDGTCEECDQGGFDTSVCDFNCTFAVCGDEYQNEAAGEGCDDGNTENDDGC